MHELPEIETIKNVIEPQIKGLIIRKITVNHIAFANDRLLACYTA